MRHFSNTKLTVIATFGLLFWLLFGLLALTLTTHAQASTSTNQPFQNGASLLSYMRSQGLNPSNVDWRAVGQVCARELQHSTEAYHECRYVYAERHLLHRSDRQECAVVAESHYPNRRIRLASGYRHNGLRNSHHFNANRLYSRDISNKELRLHRRASVINCMKSLGWASATNWRLGVR